MLRVYKVGILHELVTRNPVVPVETRAVTSYRAILVTPQQTLAILQNLQNPLHRILVLTCAATALRSSELLALRWADVTREGSASWSSRNVTFVVGAPPISGMSSRLVCVVGR